MEGKGGKNRRGGEEGWIKGNGEGRGEDRDTQST